MTSTEQVLLNAESRTETGKGSARRFRKNGKVPGIMYKAGETTAHLCVERERLSEIVKLGQNVLINLVMEGKEKTEQIVMIKALQRDPVFSKLLHVDFIGIDLDKPLVIEVPLELVGTPLGVTTGGILQQNLRQLLIRCLPDEIPRSIAVDVSELELGENLHVKNISLPEGVECIDESDTAVAGVLAPTIEVEEETEGEEVEEKAEAAEKKEEGAEQKESAEKKDTKEEK